jgi:hypothetical protein
LLAAGANPNLLIYAADSPEGSVSSGSSSSVMTTTDDPYFRGSTCLVEACRNRDMGIIDLLLKYSARDDDCKALVIVIGMYQYYL